MIAAESVQQEPPQVGDDGGGGGWRLYVIQPDPSHLFECVKLRATMSFTACLTRRARTFYVYSARWGPRPDSVRPLHAECTGCGVGERNAAAFKGAKVRRFRHARCRA